MDGSGLQTVTAPPGYPCVARVLSPPLARPPTRLGFSRQGRYWLSSSPAARLSLRQEAFVTPAPLTPVTPSPSPVRPPCSPPARLRGAGCHGRPRLLCPPVGCLVGLAQPCCPCAYRSGCIQGPPRVPGAGLASRRVTACVSRGIHPLPRRGDSQSRRPARGPVPLTQPVGDTLWPLPHLQGLQPSSLGSS